jgi:hypothetical protein
MALPEKATGSGTKASISLDGQEYKPFASITKLSPPSMSRGTVDVTDMNSYENNDQMKEFLTDFIEAEEMSIEGYVKKTDEGRDLAEQAFYSGEVVHIKITLPPAIGKTMTVKGLMTSYRPIGDISTDAGIAFTMGLKPTAKPTLAATEAATAQ